VNLGFVEKDKTVRFRVPFENLGDTPAKVSIEYDMNQHTDLAFDMTKFTVDARAKRDLILTYFPKDKGDFR
jgi:hypothetical protein